MHYQQAGSRFRRLEFLDSLRGFAALYVVIYHMAFIPQPDLVIPGWLQPLVAAGGTGVTLFFILSAFSLCYSWDKRNAESRPVRNFYWRRFFRIAPLFYVMLALYYFRDMQLFDVKHDSGTVLINSLFLFNLLPEYMESYVWAGWTIGVEMLFYLAFPFLYLRMRDKHSAFIAFLMLVLFAALWLFVVNQYGVHFGFVEQNHVGRIRNYSVFVHMPIFVFGIFTYHLFNTLQARLKIEDQEKCGALLLSAAVFLFFSLILGKLGIFWGSLFWQTLIFSLLLLGLGLLPFPALVNRFTVFTGKLSYSLYLLHPTLIYLLIPLYLDLYSRFPINSLAFAASFLITLGILIPLSFISFHLIERPGIRLGERFLRRTALPAPTAEQSN